MEDLLGAEEVQGGGDVAGEPPDVPLLLVLRQDKLLHRPLVSVLQHQADDLLLHEVTVVLHQVAMLDLLEKADFLTCHVCRLLSCVELLHCKALALLVGKKYLAKPPRPQEFGRLVIVH